MVDKAEFIYIYIDLLQIDFIWVTREQTHLNWFHQVFKEVEHAQSSLGIDPPIVNLHIYLTALKGSTDVRGSFLHLALEMVITFFISH